ncbi:MAG: HAMP domain-containing sensor histidine kinase [Bacteroidota bacterium]
MRLLTKTNLYFVAASLVVFCIGGVFFYILFQLIIDNDLTTKLQSRKAYVVKQITESDSLLLYQKFSSNTINIEQIAAMPYETETVSDTVLRDDVEGKLIGYRQLSFYKNINGRNYKIQVRRMLVETQDLIQGVIILEAFLFLAFVAILAVLNNQLSRRIWKPFYLILETINTYKIDHAEHLRFSKSSITEFSELSVAIEKMTTKINKEFNNQKEFTENASHEIQTPLAIIKNKLELLLQTSGLDKDQLSLITAASAATNRLSKLNEALIILAKIENQQFHAVGNICVNELIDNHLSNLDELIKIKEIKVRKSYQEIIYTKMNPFLAEILFENLIVNAIKHNNSLGFISITLGPKLLIISNSGNNPTNNTDKIFQRFVKGNQKSQSLGLGLPIVKAICDTYLMPLGYRFENGIYSIELQFT